MLALFAAPSLLVLQGAYAHYFVTSNDYYSTLMWTSPNEPPVAGVPTQVYFFVSNTSTGEPLPSLDVVHERLMHVFIVGQDFQTFVHTHPDDFPNGTSQGSKGIYSLSYVFPRPGLYSVVSDYTYNGLNVIHDFNIQVVGNGTKMGAPQLDYSRNGTFDGYDVSINLSEEPVAGKEVEIDYHLSQNGSDVRDLQLLLGTETHVAIFKDDLSTAGHTHAYIPGHFVHLVAMPQKYTGPNVPVRYTFTDPGNYVVFAQFKDHGQIITTKFALHVADNVVNTVTIVAGFGFVSVFIFFLFKSEIMKLVRRRG